ncbi:PREDICTED: WEB family protein At1g12150 [Theobroma cacao]|uniref:WEB family protein At1g12150 n=1 Tax=Theobroma cacao TaxID=3641 RepID=A0AB32WKM1_THECC|nr:PREDICTED: WEB family protein At1g12150 [Theobroma cacao]XP_017979285.1 PREDICTED: WEB family protein At1g12150 [Theobroma cacao]
MVNIRRVNSERLPKSLGSPRAEVGEIDTRVPFQSVKAAVSLFGEVAVSRERRTPRKSRLSAENVIDKETQLLLAQKEINNIKQKLESDESTKAKADFDLESAKRTLQDLTSKLETITQSKRSAIEATEAVKEQARQLELQKSKNHQESNARKMELEYAREQYMAVATELDAAKQELNEIRQDFDAALEAKLAAFQQAAEAQRCSKMHAERVSELSKEISGMKEAIQQVKLATQQVYQEQANIAEEKDALQKSYKKAKEETENKLISSRKEYDPELTKYLEEKLMETTAEVEALQEEMKKAHALEMDSVRVITSELNEATTTLQQVADEECSLRNLVSSLGLELEEVKRERQAEMDKEAKTVAEQNELRDHNFRLQQLSSEIENARREEQEMKKSTEELKIEAETAKVAAEEVQQKLERALEQAEEAKAAEKKAVDEMQVLSAKEDIGNTESSGKIIISMEEFESLNRKVVESGDMADWQIADAMAELEAINARKSETEKRLEASLKAMEEIKAATELAEKSATMAEAAQGVIEGELKRRRQQEQMVAP